MKDGGREYKKSYCLNAKDNELELGK